MSLPTDALVGLTSLQMICEYLTRLDHASTGRGGGINVPPPFRHWGGHVYGIDLRISNTKTHITRGCWEKYMLRR